MVFDIIVIMLDQITVGVNLIQGILASNSSVITRSCLKQRHHLAGGVCLEFTATL